MLVVMVNGIPGAGKTTLARSLAEALRLPLFSKDSIKETLADMLGTDSDETAARQWSQKLGAAAGETLWTLLSDAHHGAVLESPWLAHLRPVVVAGLERAQVDVGDVHEIWCEVPLDVARERYESRMRLRHPVHIDNRVDDALWNEWKAHAEPLALGHVYPVDTTIPVDVASLVARIHDACGGANDGRIPARRTMSRAPEPLDSGRGA